MNASELMIKKSQEYFESIKSRCNEKIWDCNFEDKEFIVQAFDEIQGSIMCNLHGNNYYSPNDWDDNVESDYEKTSDIRSDFTNEAYYYVLDQKELVKPDELES